MSSSSVIKAVSIRGTDGRTKQAHMIVPQHQEHSDTTRNVVVTTVASNPPVNLFTNGSTMYNFIIPRNTSAWIEHVVLKIRGTITGASSVFVPTWQFFDRIRILANGDTSAIQTFYPDTLQASIQSALREGQLQAISKNLNCDFSSEFRYAPTAPKAVGTTVDFYLPIPSSFFAHLNADFTNQAQDLIFELTSAVGGIVQSGGGGFALNGLSLVIESQDYDSSYAKAKAQKGYICSTNFLEPVPILAQSRQFSPGVPTLVDLIALTGRCSHLIVTVRPPGTQTVGFQRALNIGNSTGTMDILSPSNQSILGAGTALGLSYIMNEVVPSHHQSNTCSTLKNNYIVPFADSIPSAYGGQVRGVFEFQQTNTSLALTPATSAPVQEVQTISTVDGLVATAGGYRFSFGSEFSAALPFNATPAQMQSAIVAMKSFARFGTTAVVSNSFAASSGVVSITFTTPETEGLGNDGATLQVVGIQGANTVRTVQGTAGLLPGQYDIQIYAMMYKTVSYANGRFHSELL
jgi:hypothetical protein